MLPANPQWNHDVGSVQIAGDTATAIDCEEYDGQLVQRSDGTVLNDAVVATFLWNFPPRPHRRKLEGDFNESRRAMGWSNNMRHLTKISLIVLLMSFAAEAAGATVTPGQDADQDTGTISASVTVTASDLGYSVTGYLPPSGSGSISMLCYYFGQDPDVSLPGPDISAGPIWPPVVGDVYYLYCFTGGDWLSGDVVENQIVVYDPANPLGSIAVEQRSLDLARSQVVLPPPVIDTAPPAAAGLLVGLPSWYWLEGWTATSTSATLGGVTSTVTATPVTSTWDPGDDTTPTTCTGGGTAWYHGADSTNPPCGHLYTHTGTYTLTVTVTWDVTWTSTSGPGGPLPPLTTTTNIPVRVDEVQAVIG